MSDHIPFHIQVEIMKLLPVKSLLQFRSVSKTWKTLIDSSEFIADHRVRHDHSHHLLVKYQDPEETKPNYVSFVDDHTIPEQRYVHTVPPFIDLLLHSNIIGSSHGLFCVYGYTGKECKMVVVWNPSIRKSVAISVPHVLSSPYYTVLGFGICPGTTDPKLVKINCILRLNEDNITSVPIPWQVEVFTLSSWAWRTPCSNLPRKSARFRKSHTAVDGFIYWLAIDEIVGGRSRYYNLIMSFDLRNDEFREVDLPISLAENPHRVLSICKLRESLAVVRNDLDTACCVWVMERGVPTSFTKILTIQKDSWIRFMGFRKSGEAIIYMPQRIDDINQDVKLFGFEPYSGSFSDLGICGHFMVSCVISYTETLLLVNQPHGALYLHQDLE